jgi:glucose/arabinose dehydrogenase
MAATDMEAAMRSNTLRVLIPSFALAGTAGMTACGGGGGDMSAGAPLTPPVVTPPVTPPATLQLALQTVASGLSQPLYLTAPAGDSRLFIVERPGRIRIVANGALLPTPFLDISPLTTTDGERGLLSMAFHPQYAQNGSFFIYYTDTSGDIVVDRMKVSSSNANVADPASVGRVITIPHRDFSNHNGGQLAFGADGYLYIGTGDGGGAGDPQRNGQNLNALLGKILRLDVGIVVPGQAYGIPSGNPYAGQAGRRGEIWAAGLRNPWRFAFDRTDGLLYIADVGQDQREEVDVAPAAQGGRNYGWNIMEGTACYNAAGCNQAGLTLPVFEYLHGANDANGCSITGGYVYRGAAIPELAGTYFYSDYCKGYLKSFVYRNGAVSGAQEWAVDNPGNVLSFGQDAQGELYVLAGSGRVYRIVRR